MTTALEAIYVTFGRGRLPPARRAHCPMVDGGVVINGEPIGTWLQRTDLLRFFLHQKLVVVLPLSLALIFLILYFQFKTVGVTLIVFSSIAVAWGGGFTMLYWYGQDWFLNFDLLGMNMRELFQLHPINLSVAVWVGFLALFGIAVDDGVVMATYLRQSFAARPTNTIPDIRAAVVEAGLRRVRPCLMTSATTILALLPVLTATGRGADLMIPMALPTLGGMGFVLLALFTVPVLYSWREERLAQAAARQA